MFHLIFICTLPHPTEGRARRSAHQGLDLHSNLFHWTLVLCGVSGAIVWSQSYRGDIFRLRHSAFQFMVWSESVNAKLCELRATEKYILSCWVVKLVLEKYCLWMRTEWVIERLLAHGFENDILQPLFVTASVHLKLITVYVVSHKFCICKFFMFFVSLK